MEKKNPNKSHRRTNNSSGDENDVVTAIFSILPRSNNSFFFFSIFFRSNSIPQIRRWSDNPLLIVSVHYQSPKIPSRIHVDSEPISRLGSHSDNNLVELKGKEEEVAVLLEGVGLPRSKRT